MHTYCATKKAAIIFAIPVEGSCMLIPSYQEQIPGIILEVTPGKLINDHIKEVMERELGYSLSAADFNIEQKFAEKFVSTDPAKDSYTLYVALSHKRHDKAEEHWRSFPDILRNMEKNRLRLIYLKAWQVVMGADQGQLRAVEFDGERDASSIAAILDEQNQD